MQKDIIENWQKMTTLALENFKKLGEANLRIGEKLLGEQVKLTNCIREAASCGAECATEAKDFAEVATQQAEWAQECSKKVAESSRACADILAEAGKVYTAVFESGLKAANATSEKTGGGKARKSA